MFTYFYFFEVGRGEPTWLIGIKSCTTAIDGSEIGQILIFGEGESDFIENAVKLCIALNTEEGHKLYFYNKENRSAFIILQTNKYS